MDKITKEQRAKIMASIKSKNTSPEIIICKLLKKNKFSFRQNDIRLVGTPDFVFWRKKIVIFVDSDFWHGHPSRFVMPKTNVLFWKNKIEKNRKRDKKVNRLLRKNGWIVIRLWEHDIKYKFTNCVNRLGKVFGRELV